MSLVPPEIPAVNPNLLPLPVHQTPNEVVPDEETSRFNYPGSDIVLRSRDSYNFPLPKLNIVICSPVLRKLIESVSNTSDVLSGEEREPPSLPIIEIPESKETLYHLLTFIFPITPVLPPTPEKIMELLAVAQKYEMSSVMSHIPGAISRQYPPFLRSETAFQIYFLAQQHGLHHEAAQAARVTLHFPAMTIEGLEDKLDFAGMTGAALHELWKYHRQVQSDLKLAVFEFRNTGLPDDVKSLICASPYHGNTRPQWLYEYINSVAKTPLRYLYDCTEFEEVRARHVQSFNSYGPCSCATMPNDLKRSFREALTAVVHGVLEKVRRIGVSSTPHRDS